MSAKENTAIQTYKKKPVEIQAARLPSDGVNDSHVKARIIADWCGGTVKKSGAHLTDAMVIVIPTLEGDMLASPGDWVIRGVKGEFYPCKPDIFEATYDAV